MAEVCRDCKRDILVPEFAYRGALVEYGVICAACTAWRERARVTGGVALTMLRRVTTGIGALVGASTLTFDGVEEALGASSTVGVCVALVYPSTRFVAACVRGRQGAAAQLVGA